MILRSLKVYLKQKWNPDNIARWGDRAQGLEAPSMSTMRRQNGLAMSAALP